MGGKVSKKKKAYDISDTKEKQDGDANNIETKSAAQLSEQTDSTVGAEEPAAENNSAESTEEASAVSQEVASSQAPTTEGAKAETQEKAEAVTKEEAPSAPAQTQKPEEPSSGSEPQVSLPTLEAPVVKKADEPKVTEKVVTPSPQAPETQVVEETPAVVSAPPADVVVEPVSKELDTQPPVTALETSVQVKEDTVETTVLHESTTQSEAVIPSEQGTAVTNEVATGPKEAVEVSAVQSTTEVETITSENATAKTVDETTVQKCTTIPIEQASAETVRKSITETVIPPDALETVQETVICETTESPASTVQEHVTHTEILEPTQAPLPVPEELPEVKTTDEGKTTESIETKSEAEVKGKSDKVSGSSEPENVETGLSSQADVPVIALNSENAEAAVTEVVPEIIISESISTNEFPGDDVAKCVAAEEKVVESAVEGHDQENAIPLVVPEVNTQVNAPEDVPTSDCGTALVEEGKVENGKHELPTPDLNGETKATKSQNEECVNGIGSPDGTPKDERVSSDCDRKKDLIADIEVPTVIGDMASAINTTANELDLV